jgi:hypothetical protein
MELETAVRLKSNLVHMILIDGSYDRVAEQEILALLPVTKSMDAQEA